MEKFNEIYEKYKNYILGGVLALILIIGEAFLFWYFSNDINYLKQNMKKEAVSKAEVKEVTKQFIVDIKGEVKNPGVYILDEGKRVIDVVRKAGGFTVNADSSANNLSMKIKDEMVIVIYSKEEIDDFEAVKEAEKIVSESCQNGIVNNDSCITSDTIKDSKSTDASGSNDNSSSEESSQEVKKVSLNNASLEELMTLSGIGEAKAKSIIEYRKEKKFEKIEDIMNVSGIGESVFEKIKDYITT